jgi:flagellar protein FlaI
MKNEDSLEKYKITVDDVTADINIVKSPEEFVRVYKMISPKIKHTTHAILETIREKLISDIEIKPIEIIDPKEMEKLKNRFNKDSFKMIQDELPRLPKDMQKTLAGMLTHESVGLGILELLLNDSNIEEIAINSSKKPIWVYHIHLGWLKTNIIIPSETDIYNYAALIGRRVGVQITNLNPLMDAYLTTGDRSNATLFPISSNGNTITIRRFARRPWTITDFIKSKTISTEVAAFLWLAIQYEMNILIAGGTASGKTSMLNVLSSFIPPNHRVISIEETREIQLPKFLHWVPLTTRPPNPEGKGEVTMLQLMINSLRMRPDRIIFGEIRRAREAEVLFEAIHTGHSVYSTLHANTGEETLRRLTNPPIDIPSALLNSLQIILVMHRDRRREIRRVIEVSEIYSETERGEIKMQLNPLFNWIPSKDDIISVGESKRVLSDIRLYTGMTDKEFKKDREDKMKILNWFVKNNINDIHEVASFISEYYTDPEGVLRKIKSSKKPQPKVVSKKLKSSKKV